MLIDAFTYNGEEDVLEVRLNTLAGFVDRFVLVEANKTFSGQPKPFSWLAIRDDSRFRDFNVTPVNVTDMPNAVGSAQPTAWAREYHQRNCILRGIETAPDDATVLISDVDEIPTQAGIDEAMILLEGGALLPYLEMAFFYYSMQHAMPGRWFGTRVVSAATARSKTPQWLRARGTVMVPNAGWHFSYLGDIASIQRKLAAFSHQEFNVAPFNTAGHIRAQIFHNVDFLRGQRMRLIEGTAHLPPFVQANLDRFGKYLVEADKVTS